MTAPHVALVTGASRGLGRTLAGFLAARGDALVVTARGKDELEEAAAELRQGGAAAVRAPPGDVADPAHRARLVAAARDLGGLDLLVNNASLLGPSPLPDLVEADPGDLREVLEVNLVAPLALTAEALPLLRERRGLVVNVTSDAARGAYPGWGVYGASKAALELATRTLAAELEDVAVVAVDPGDLRTRMHQEAFPGEDISDRPLPEVTVPFWAWLLGQDPPSVDGGRFEAQGETWALTGVEA